MTAYYFEGGSDDYLYQVYLIAEDGEYCLTNKMSHDRALEYVRTHESRYGEGQELAIRYEGFYGW